MHCHWQVWSAFRESSFGHGILDFLNDTTVVWNWQRATRTRSMPRPATRYAAPHPRIPAVFMSRCTFRKRHGYHAGVMLSPHSKASHASRGWLNHGNIYWQ